MFAHWHGAARSIAAPSLRSPGHIHSDPRLEFYTYPFWVECSPIIVALNQGVDDLHACRFEMPLVVGGDGVSMKQGCGSSQGILAHYRAISALELPQQFFPAHQHRLSQVLGGRGE